MRHNTRELEEARDVSRSFSLGKGRMDLPPTVTERPVDRRVGGDHSEFSFTCARFETYKFEVKQATGYMSLEFRTEVQVEIEMWESPAYGSYLESRNWKRSPSRDIDRKRSQALKPSIVKRSRRWGEISKGWTSKTRKTRFLEAEQWTGFKESTIDYWMQLMSQGGRGRGRSTCT